VTDYRFPTRIERIAQIRSPEIEIEIKPKERGEVMGITASFAEYMVALVLYYLRLRFYYKWKVPNTKYTVDFLIDMNGEWLLLDVNNFKDEYQTSTQRLRKRIIQNITNKELHMIWDTETVTFEMALSALRRLLR